MAEPLKDFFAGWSTADLQTLQSTIATQMLANAGRFITHASSGDVTVEKAFGFPLADIQREVVAELRKRGTITAKVTRTRVQFS